MPRVERGGPEELSLNKITFAWLSIAAVVSLLGGGCTSASKAPPPPALTAQQTAKNVESFDVVHARIKERNFDTAKVGPEWDAKHAELRPKVEQARTNAEAREVSNQLIATLHQSHMGVIPGDAYDDAPDAKGSEDTSGEPGFEVRAIEGRPVVTRVIADSPAAGAGVKPGWVLVSVDGKPLQPTLDKLTRALKGRRESGLMISNTLNHATRGPEGSTATMVLLDGQDKAVELKIQLREPPGKPINFGNLPTMFMEIDRTARVPGIGYFWFSIWFDPPRLMTELQEAVLACKDCEGFIIDLRGNIGGIGALAMGVGSWFVDKPNQQLGTMITRDSKLNFVLNPRPNSFGKPLAILVDEMSASTSEIFAGGMRDIGRARVFGSPTPGAALPSTVEVLPNGDRLQFAFANYISAKGEALEANGVPLDEQISRTRADLLAGRDPVLDAAVAWIRSQAAAR